MTALRRWARQMLERKGGRSGFKLTAVALANKLGAHRVCDPALGRSLRRSSGRGLSEKGSARGGFAARRKGVEGDQRVM